jgi:hypothetical protein
MGKDAKAIKFMVNIEQDLQPQFSETIQDLEALKGPAWLMMDNKDFQALKGTNRFWKDAATNTDRPR